MLVCLFAFSPLRRLLISLSHWKQKSSTVSRKLPTVSKNAASIVVIRASRVLKYKKSQTNGLAKLRFSTRSSMRRSSKEKEASSLLEHGLESCNSFACCLQHLYIYPKRAPGLHALLIYFGNDFLFYYTYPER